ncbi:hypothetical protein FALBO_9391 [Fusarium albosuccineum]|uniref:Uncharacterized protein n=1 Tax=Fusarium albosuccineum TaxID=1237068 RepID=A0A8H4PJ18_9HYPO|nr:hypothetical protein FALBO_9391 [Fusarium albosuccineum]
MVSPGIDASQKPDANISSNIENHRPKDASGNISPSKQVSNSEQQPELQLFSHKSNQTDVSPECNSPSHTAVGKPEIGNGRHSRPECSNPTPPKGSMQVPEPHKRRISVSVTSEGGHHYIRCTNVGRDPGSGLNLSPWKDHIPVLSWEQDTERQPQGDWQFRQDRTTPSPHFISQYPNPSSFGARPTPAPASRVPPTISEPWGSHIIYHRPRVGEEDARMSGGNTREESMKEFIERIEAEVMMKWNEPQHATNDTRVDGSGDVSEQHAAVSEKEDTPSQSDNFERPRTARPNRNDMWSRAQQRQPEHGKSQPLFSSWENESDMTRPRSTMPTIEEDNDSADDEAEMLAFWKPNRF